MVEEILRLFPQYYNIFRRLLGSYNPDQILILQAIRAHEGSLSRPVLCEQLGFDSKRAHYLINPLRMKGLIYTERTGREATDEVTDKGNKEFEEIREMIKPYIKQVVSLMADEEREALSRFLEKARLAIEKVFGNF